MLPYQVWLICVGTRSALSITAVMLSADLVPTQINQT